jgi:hypothetical protein
MWKNRHLLSQSLNLQGNKMNCMSKHRTWTINDDYREIKTPSDISGFYDISPHFKTWTLSKAMKF